jgi:hypothetical protein
MVESWVTAAEVADRTGVTVDASDVAAAQDTIEIVANRTYAATPGITSRDLVWLRKAVCWQAAWYSQQFGFAFRQSGTSVSADGQSINRESRTDTYLAPLADRALRNLSWKGTRTVRRPRVETPLGYGMADEFASEASDDQDGTDWSPM